MESGLDYFYARYYSEMLGRFMTPDWAGKPTADSAYPQWGLAQTYDRYGNRLSQTVTAGSGPQTSMAFNNNNQPIGYTYDASGNMTVEPLYPPNDMIYDGENRMTAFSGGGGLAYYDYDGNGLRVFKWDGDFARASVYSGSQVVAEYDNDNEDPSTPAVEYIYNPAGGPTTGLLAMISGGATTYFHQDDKSVRLTTDASGNVLTQQGTYPFGEPWYSSSSLAPGDNWVFTSYNRDSESGLDYALARYYDSRTGTFCSADPLAGDPGDPQSWNRYAYGRNDPIDMSDPSGKSWWSSLLIDAGIAIAMYFAPEIDSFLSNEWSALFGSSATGADSTFTPVLLTRTAAQATTTIAEGAGDAAAAGTFGGLGAGLGGAAAAQAAQSTDQPRPQQQGPRTPIAPNNGRCLSNVQNFVNAHLQDAQTLAGELGSGATANEVLATSGNETGWGGGFADIGNYFGIHGAGPNGTYWTTGTPSAPVAEFPVSSGFLMSGQVFVGLIRPYLTPQIAGNPFSFFSLLNQHGYATGNPSYAADMVSNGSRRGPYTLVNACNPQ